MNDERLHDEHLVWLRRLKEQSEEGGVWLVEGSDTSETVWTIDRNLYSDAERSALADLIRWGHCQWVGFIAGGLGCEITDKGLKALEAP